MATDLTFDVKQGWWINRKETKVKKIKAVAI
jgi:hypothetical protein